MRRIALIAAASAMLLALSACGLVTSEHPLSTDETSVFDARLVGRWQAQPPDPDERPPVDLLYVGRLAETANTLEVAWHEMAGDAVERKRLEFRPTKIGEDAYASVASLDEPQGWIVLRYELPEESRLHLLFPSLSVVARAIEAGALKGRLEKKAAEDGEATYEGVHVTASPEAFREWIAAHAETLFDAKEKLLLHRIDEPESPEPPEPPPPEPR